MKSFVIILLLLLTSWSAKGQAISELEYKTGLLFSNYIQTDLDNKSEESIFFTLSYSRGISDSPLFFKIEASYKDLGSFVDLPVNDNPANTQEVRRRFNNNYIGLSLQSGAILFKESRINPKFYLGPSMEILIDSKLTSSIINGEFAPGFDAIVTDLEDQTEDLIFGVNMGFGVDFRIQSVKIGADFRYFTSFTNLYNEDIFAIELEDAKHEYFGVMIGFQFPL